MEHKKIELIEEINKLRKEKNAIILAHNYQRPDVQDIADFVGDSLNLCQKAAEAQNIKIIVFAGVDFMAESAKILNPNKLVLMPDLGAVCPMAAMVRPKMIQRARKKYPNTPVVAYINTSAEVKAEADVICTSANFVKIIEKLEASRIIFTPDRNMAWWVAQKTSKEIIPVPEYGHCPTHMMIFPDPVFIEEVKVNEPSAELIAHPECIPEILEMADHVYGTEGMVKYAKQTKAKKLIIATEVGLLHRLRKEVPDKVFTPADSSAICPQMKKHTLDKILYVLKTESNAVEVNPKIADLARNALKRMFELTQ
ncbi:MAG: quinolinate synthase NadA [Euryarchaeota archaeon]|nr:quinolinate synthase NadA [Euryarchaeota archaeon]